VSFIRNRNWKKILVHEGVEYGILGLFVWWQGLPGLFAGLVVAFAIHMFFFELVDRAHERATSASRKRRGVRKHARKK